MAGKQSSEVKRRTASTRKTTTTRKSSAGKKRNTSGKSANTKVSRMQVSEYTEPVGDEIKLIIILAVSILILLSVFGLGGRVGDKAAYLFFGLFGFVAYALPFLLFIGSAFHISNRGSRLARIKLTAATVFLIMIMALMALADSSFDGSLCTGWFSQFSCCSQRRRSDRVQSELGSFQCLWTCRIYRYSCMSDAGFRCIDYRQTDFYPPGHFNRTYDDRYGTALQRMA